MAHRHKRKGGGKAPHEQIYNAKGSHEEHEGEDEKPGFKRGGHREKHKRGGHVHGHKAKHHGGRGKRAAGGKSPYSSGHHTSGPTDSTRGRGHEGVMPSSEGD